MSTTAPTTRRKVGPAAYEVTDTETGQVLGTYGGREGARWATTASGTIVTQDSAISAGTVRSLLERAAREEAAR